MFEFLQLTKLSLAALALTLVRRIRMHDAMQSWPQSNSIGFPTYARSPPPPVRFNSKFTLVPRLRNLYGHLLAV